MQSINSLFDVVLGAKINVISFQIVILKGEKFQINDGTLHQLCWWALMQN
jgi:hypothetical protein